MQFSLLLCAFAIGSVEDFDRLRKMAITLEKPLVVFVNCPIRTVPGAIAVRHDEFPGFDRAIVVTVPKGSDLWHLNQGGLDTKVGTDVILQEIAKTWEAVSRPEREARRQPSPFRDELPSKTADAEQARLVSLWPDSLPWIDGLAAYKPTQHTQRLAITDGAATNNWYRLDQDEAWTNERPENKVNPNRIFPWAVPGGLHYSTGWQSVRGIRLPSQIRVWNQRVPVANSSPLPKWCWEFPDGTAVVDLLAKDGKAFEVRVRQKANGQWTNHVVHADKEQRPRWFHGAGRDCQECHAHAGTSQQYGITVRGSDEVFSYNPLIEHKRGAL